ncbi:hypothetical protein PLICRDRAFT_350213 [Plicaturopsis crispa FD-325 SS-3]|uniref:Uncharacterized protein n=1 Tax=Plicaturopsis crispa FD-325 SS-3 TaxID=944288 RepID=A0A0C9T9P2_PLICR|nr:hypothetical protein PLICRDRAFT_350213 [Plicaturopsis crispa FD-325 SS-3]
MEALCLEHNENYCVLKCSCCGCLSPDPSQSRRKCCVATEAHCRRCSRRFSGSVLTFTSIHI